VPKEGTKTLMRFLIDGTPLAPSVGLFVNDVFPDKDTTLASLTEASFVGYSRRFIGSPASVSTLPDGAARLLWTPVNWVAAPSPMVQTIRGVFVVQLDLTLTTRLLWVERMSPVAIMPLPHPVLVLNPKFDFSTLFV